MNHIASPAMYQAGIGYHLFTDKLSQHKYFNDLLVELNLYHANASINGQVLQFGQSDLTNYAFQAPLSNTRLMIDVKPGLFTLNNMTPYPIFGVGVAWNTLSYNETPYETIPGDSYTNLQSNLNRKISYDAGLGVRYKVSSHINASVEYLYNYIGNISSSANSVNAAVSSSAVSFLTHSQAVLLGLSWKF